MREPHPLSLAKLYRHFQENDGPAHARTMCRLVRLSRTDPVAAIRGHVLGDDWLDFTVESLSTHFLATRGFVYLACSLDHEGLVKLGKTGKSPAARMASLSGETVVHDYTLVHAQQVHDRHWVELACHARLVAQGVFKFKEFFPAYAARYPQVIAEAAGQDCALFEARGLGACLWATTA